MPKNITYNFNRDAYAVTPTILKFDTPGKGKTEIAVDAAMDMGWPVIEIQPVHDSIQLMFDDCHYAEPEIQVALMKLVRDRYNAE